LPRVEAVVAGADIDVVYIAQDTAAGTLGNGGDKLPFGDCRMAEAQITARILDENLPAEKILHHLDVLADDCERVLGQWEGQQFGEMHTFERAPRQVLRDEARLDSFSDSSQPCQMRDVEAVSAAQRQPDPVQ